MPATAQAKSPRDRILRTAMDLFYRQGYTATGINQIIGEAAVARASFYAHFPSKEDLLLAYATEMSRMEIGGLRSDVAALSTARERFFGPLEILPPWLVSSGFRGCPFQNVMAEVPPDAIKVWEVARQHRESIRAFIRELALDLKISDPAFGHLDPEKVATTYLMIFEGVISTCVAYRETWPIPLAKDTLLVLLTKASA